MRRPGSRIVGHVSSRRSFFTSLLCGKELGNVLFGR